MFDTNWDADQTEDVVTPNAETVEAMKAARRGELVEVGSVDNLLANLQADD